MTPELIKKIRAALRLTQDDLATILGVTKHTVWRYEDGRGEPGDDITAKLLNLEASLGDPNEEERLKVLRKNPGGIAAIAAVTALGAALAVGAAGAPVVGCAGIARSMAGKNLLSFLGGFIAGTGGAEPPAAGRETKPSPCMTATLAAASMSARGLVEGVDEDKRRVHGTKKLTTKKTINPEA